jgi:pSer/pThr/pTyr-binding forkhead associated (FHA) protein
MPASQPKADRPRPSSRTRLESIEEIRRAIESMQAARKQDKAEPGLVLFQPVQRPPMALLLVLDDGLQSGEWLRIRQDLIAIGRTEGDVRIPHDELISGAHVEIRRAWRHGRWRWILADLESTNGTYVRVSDAALRHGQELILGMRRFRFEAARPGAPEEYPPANGHSKTSRWEENPAPAVVPSLVELLPQGVGHRLLLNQGEHWIGRDHRQCSLAFPDDLLLNPRHARLYRDPRGRWHVENSQSRNGTWIRIKAIPMDTSCQFQIGEQRLLFRPLG